jgi:hypothetical protein
MRLAKSTVAVLAAFIFSSLLAGNLFAQTSSIAGTVVDSDGSKVKFVSVTATNTATGLQRIGNSDEAGTYAIDRLTAGTYTLIAEVEGYVVPALSNVTLGETETKKVDFTVTMTTTERMFRKTWPLFNWAEGTWVGTSIRNSQYPFAVIEVFHLFGLTLLLGGIFMMSLRLFGLIMRDTPLSLVARQLGWVSFSGLVVMVVTGLPLFASEALKCYSNNMYWYKMAFFFPATIFHFTMYRKVTRSDTSQPFMRGLTGFLALFLWFGVAVFGRAIGYF